MSEMGQTFDALAAQGYQGTDVSYDLATDEVAYRVDDNVATITLTRDAKRNSLTAPVCYTIRTYVHKAVEDNARVILLRGEGSSFCAGADLSGGVYTADFHVQLFTMLHSLTVAPIPVVADIQGPAVGAGTQLALASDLRVVGDHAWFKIPVVNLGIAVDNWTIERCRELMGGSRARTFLYTATPLSAEDAVRCGFASLHGNSDLAAEYARELAHRAPLTLQHLKSVLNAPTPEPTAHQQELLARCWTSRDAQEARLARKEKRDPKFEGR